MRKSICSLLARIGVASLLLAFSLPSHATRWSDLWSNPSESGWGINIIQQQTTLFMTLFVYGSDGKSKFYVASGATPTGQTTSAGYSIYSGALYETTGPWFGTTPFNPTSVGVRQVGTMTFSPSTYYSGQLTYSVDGVNVSKTIQRQTWSHITLSGKFAGSMVVSRSSNCGAGSDPLGTVYNGIGLMVTANTATSAVTIVMTQSGTVACTFTGTYTQFGNVYRLTTTGTGTCTAANWNFADYVVDDDAISGNLNASSGTCRLGYQLGLVRLP